jgi:chaperonin GroES
MSDAAYADAPEDVQDADDAVDAAPEAADRLEQFATADGDISEFLTDDELEALGAKVVDEWNSDRGSIQSWRDAAEKALKQASQENGDIKTFPWMNSSNIQYPLLTVASQQFAARAYPAIVKGDEAVGVKVIGDAPQKPDIPDPPPAQPGQPPPELPAEVQQAMQQFAQAVGARTAKEARAKRVKTWMNYHIFYGMDDWETGVDTMLNVIPIMGMGFKKVYFDPHRGVCSDFVNALHLTVHKDTESLERCPRVTQDFQLYPYEIKARMASGVYRDIDDIEFLQSGDDEQAPRTVLEQHRLEDMDDDGIDEPYIVTVDEESGKVLRIEAAYGVEDIARSKKDDKVTHVRRWMPFIAFPFMPDPQGGFYGLGFGQLLAPLTAVINTSINQLMDAGTAAAAGGGFIGSGLRLQGAGQPTTLRFQPGEFKTVNAQGNNLREAIFERTIPAPSPVLFQLLDLIMGAAKDVASIKDVLTGEAPATAPVGTTLALIEQGLQAFSAIYKRVYRSLKAEFAAIYECEGKWGSPEEYQQVLDDPNADLKADFSPKGSDIVPVSDPSVITKAQALAKAQVIQQVAGVWPNAVNPATALRRVFEAAGIDNPDELIVQPPKEPPPNVIADIDKTKSETTLNLAKAAQANAGGVKDIADARATEGTSHAQGATDAAFALGSTHQGRVSGVEGPPGEPVGVQGPPDGQPSPAAGVDPGVVDAGPGGPPIPDGTAQPS